MGSGINNINPLNIPFKSDILSNKERGDTSKNCNIKRHNDENYND